MGMVFGLLCIWLSSAIASVPGYLRGFPERPPLRSSSPGESCVSTLPEVYASRDSTTRMNVALRQELRKMAAALQPEELTEAKLEEFSKVYIRHWCQSGKVIHSACGTDPRGTSRTFKITKFRMGNAPRPTFDPDEGARGLMFITRDGKYLRVYYNAKKPTKKGTSMLYYADGNAGVMYRNGQGFNSTLSNFGLYLDTATTPPGFRASYGPDPHQCTWEHNRVEYVGGELKITGEPAFSETWKEIAPTG